jgi:hypothetical protein
MLQKFPRSKLTGSGEATGFKVGGGVKGEGTGRGVPPPAGGPKAVPPEKFSNCRCT